MNNPPANISIELAMKLKIAGFPAPKKEDSWIGKTFVGYGESSIVGGNGGVAYVPTLSELIEACGEKFWRLELNPIIANQWLVWGLKNKEDCMTIGDSGSTPEEAVAHLWLALNETPNR
jgi:hypothetical protein